MVFGQVVRVTYSILLDHDPGNLSKGLWVDSPDSGLLSNNSAKSKYNTIEFRKSSTKFCFSKNKKLDDIVEVVVNVEVIGVVKVEF